MYQLSTSNRNGETEGKNVTKNAGIKKVASFNIMLFSPILKEQLAENDYKLLHILKKQNILSSVDDGGFVYSCIVGFKSLTEIQNKNQPSF